ncbi:MAG: HAD family phosphatase [Bifidobacteriaceae bacterium]|jgi:HAD superfamily hydrolase (TIGR01509 family)|nr:HAD family phosphatase [Bifidobacteriaceae bacterium]
MTDTEPSTSVFANPAGARRAVLRGVLWDLDGTVVDSEPAWFAAETALVERYGGAWSQERALELIGADLNHTAAALRREGVPLEPKALVNALLEVVIERVMATRPCRPGVREALAECGRAGLACALVSMSWRRFTTAVADLLPGAFAAIVSGDDVTRGKPDPEAYLLGAARLGLRPDECVAVEDSPTGVASALAAGLPTVAVPNPGQLAPAPGLTILDSTEDITVALLREAHARHWGM